MGIALVLIRPGWAAFDKSKYDLENILYMELKDGRVVIEMYPKDAPNTVARIKELVRQGFYNGLTFHRVIPDFMAQTGDPKGDGTGGSGQNLKAEFNERHHLRGTVSMARAQGDDTADSQFFIMFQPKLAMDGQYTVWGRIIDGMQLISQIKSGSAGYRDGEVLNPDKILSMSVAADVDEPEVPAIDPNPEVPTPAYPGYSSETPPVGQTPPAIEPRQPTNLPATARSASQPARQSSPSDARRATKAPRVPLPSRPSPPPRSPQAIEPPQYDTVFPPIPEGGYVPY